MFVIEVNSMDAFIIISMLWSGYDDDDDDDYDDDDFDDDDD